MKYDVKRSFNRSYKKLTSTEQKLVDTAIFKLKDFFGSGEKQAGLGVKKLRWNFWEIRAAIKIRILFTLENDIVSFVIAGNHDDVVKYLKNA